MMKQEDVQVQDGNESKASLGNLERLCLQIKLFLGKKKRARNITQWLTACLASMRTWVQSLMSRQEHTHNVDAIPKGQHPRVHISSHTHMHK